MMWKAVIALLSVGIGAVLAQDTCFPQFDDNNPKPNCATEAVETWTFWNTMNYKYFAKKLTWQEAFDACNSWDGAVCAGEFPNQGLFGSHPVSIATRNEIDEAIDVAYKASCIKNGKFWTGAKRITTNGEIVFSDGTRADRTAIGLGQSIDLLEGDDCIAFNGEDGTFEKVLCSQELPFMCKIFPISH